MANAFCPTVCPSGCEEFLPVVPTFPTCDVLNDKLVSDLYITRQPLVDGDLDEWTERLSNTALLSADADAIRHLKVIDGTIPAAEVTFKTMRSGLKVPQEIDRTLEFIVEDDSDAAYSFFSQFQCGFGGLFFFKSGIHMYGGLSGIKGSLVSRYGIEQSDTDISHLWRIQMQFKSLCFPTRVAAVV